MTYKVQNIIVGAAALYLSAKDSSDAAYGSGPALPAGTTGQSLITPLNASADWRHVGFTSEGVELSYEPDYADVEVDQLLDAALTFKQGMRVAINTTFSEASLENLLVVWGQAGDTLSSTTSDSTLGIASGGLGDYPTERSLVAVGPGPRTPGGSTARRERVYQARRVLSVESSSQALRKTEATVFPVSFRLLADPAFPKAEYGLIRDRNVS